MAFRVIRFFGTTSAAARAVGRSDACRSVRFGGDDHIVADRKRRPRRDTFCANGVTQAAIQLF